MSKRKREDETEALQGNDNFEFVEDFDEKHHHDVVDDGVNEHETHLDLTFQMSDITHDDFRRIHSDMDQVTSLILTDKTTSDSLVDETLLLKGNENMLAPLVPWTEEEDYKLTEAIEIYAWGNPPTIDWDKVSEHVETHRSAEQCAKRWNNALKYRRPEYRPLPWTKQEDTLLEIAVRQYEGQSVRGGISWEKVRLELGDERTANQCRGRWNGILKHRSPNVKTTPWSAEEDELLIEGVGLNDGNGRKGTINWAAVSVHMNGARTGQQCSHRWNRVLKARGLAANSQPWTEEEDERLRLAAIEFYGQGLRGGVDWNKVHERMGAERTPQQYGHRWNRVVKFKGTATRNSPWSPEEDERLLEAISLYNGQGLRGAVDWSRVSEYMGGDRTSQQCCHRWSGVLKHRGVMKSTPWSPEEDVKLIEAVRLYQNQGLRGGISWGRVSEALNRERSCQQCAHRWNRVLRHREAPGSVNTAEWTDEEDVKLREAVLEFQGQGLRGGVDWNKVRQQVATGRTPQQYCTRWNRVLKHSDTVKQTVWTDQDDQKLIEAVSIFRGIGRGGSIDWLQVCDYLGCERTREQVSGRWNGVLKHRDIRESESESDHCDTGLSHDPCDPNTPGLFEL